MTSKQLPTLILFQDGKEVKRRPVKSAGRDGKVFPFGFTKVCKKNPPNFSYFLVYFSLCDLSLSIMNAVFHSNGPLHLIVYFIPWLRQS